jgi:hypothetical protein
MKNPVNLERLSSLKLGLGISGSLLVVLLVTETVLGRWALFSTEGEFDAFARVSSGILRDFRIAVVHCLIAGYVPAALLHVLRSGRRTVHALQKALDCSDEECADIAALMRLSLPGLLVMGLLGFAMSLAIPHFVPPVPETLWNPASWPPEVFWHRILGPIVSILQWWLGYAVITVSLRMSRIARRLDRVDLLDLSPLSPFTQQGLTNSLLLIGLVSIWSLMLLETGFGQMMILIGGTMFLLVTLALMLPVRGVHRRIREAKDAELGWVNAAIATRRTALQSNPAAGRGGEMADIVAYRALVEDVPEWPFTTSTYARIFLYALIPLASWSIGIVAEEIVGRALF